MDKDKDFTTQLMAFTFFYAVAIYVLCLGFYFWDKHIDYNGNQVKNPGKLRFLR